MPNDQDKSLPKSGGKKDPTAQIPPNKGQSTDVHNDMHESLKALKNPVTDRSAAQFISHVNGPADSDMDGDKYGKDTDNDNA